MSRVLQYHAAQGCSFGHLAPISRCFPAPHPGLTCGCTSSTMLVPFGTWTVLVQLYQQCGQFSFEQQCQHFRPDEQCVQSRPAQQYVAVFQPFVPRSE